MSVVSTGDRLPYREIWFRELRGGRFGQRIDQPGTWRRDNLWSAAIYQRRSEDAEVLLASAIDHGAHVSHIAKLLDWVEDERQRAHRAYLDGQRIRPQFAYAG